jgi:serine/threonine-protein kinase
LLWLGGRWRFGAAMPHKKVVAVLPFEPIGGGTEDQAISRGLTDLVTVRLAQVGARYGFEVVPASEVRQQEIASAEQARQKLGASLVVEGSWEFNGQHRIMYELVDTERKRNVNAAVVRADMGDLYSAENDVLQQLLGMFDVEKGGSPPTGPEPARPDAYQYYVRGRGYLLDYQNPQSLDRAIALFKVATDSDPSFALAHAGLGEAYWRRYEDSKDPQWVQMAIAACDRAATLDGNLSPLHSTLGLIYHGTGKQQEAVSQFEQALHLDATNDTASRGLAASYESLGQFDKAEAAFRQAIALRPDYWGGYHDLGVYFYKRGNLNAAGEQFAKELQLVPDNVRAYTDLGGIAYLQGRYDQARSLFQQSLKIQPSYRAYSNLGTMDFFDRKYSDAASNFEQALKIDNRDARVWRNLGWSYFWGGQAGKATPAFQHAEQLLEPQRSVNPNDGAVLILLADCYSMTGDTAKAESLLKQGLANGSDAESAFRGAEIYEKLGKRDQALAWLKTAIERGYVVSEVEKDPSLAGLRTDQRYADLIATEKNR